MAYDITKPVRPPLSTAAMLRIRNDLRRLSADSIKKLLEGEQ